MKIKQPIKFHNRFDIVKNGEWVGYAENIILDQMYSRLCNFQTYFVNIHFGTGIGTLSPTRTSLFTHLGTKVAETEEIIKALPTSKWTRKITLNPEEYVGSTITEVGIAFGATNTNLVTHAMIKDAEGNPLSITKKNLDVIVIYATVFIALNNTDSIKFVDASQNKLLKYLFGDSFTATTTYRRASTHEPVEEYYNIAPIHQVGITSIWNADVPNRKIVFPYTYAITEANMPIKAFSIADLITVYGGDMFKKNVSRIIGEGDGTTKEYKLPYSNVFGTPTITINGANTTSFIYIPALVEHTTVSLFDIIDKNDSYNDMDALYNSFIGTAKNSVTMESYSTTTVSFKTKVSLRDAQVCLIGSLNVQYDRIRLNVSSDGVSWTNHKTFYGSNLSGIISVDTLYFQIEFYKGSSGSASVASSILTFPESKTKATITFDEAPATDVVLQAQFDTDYLPKTSDYITNVDFELQFGEGV